MSSIPTPHISARIDDFAETVLMPGDPKRSRYIAENFLTNAVLVNDVRGVQGYTGFYKDNRVSVMASGMGMPSIAIYSYELFNFYNVKNIIRVGSAGAIHPELKLRDIVLGMGSCTDSNYVSQYGLPGTFAPIASYDLLNRAIQTLENENMHYMVGNLLSSDRFYDDSESLSKWRKMGVLAVEMESAALYCNAARSGKNALCICTISDCPFEPGKDCTADERQNSFTAMMRIALEIA